MMPSSLMAQRKCVLWVLTKRPNQNQLNFRTQRSQYNCQTKNNNCNILEIIVNRTTQITESQKKLNINIEPVKTETATDVNVIDINSVDDGNIVNLTAIIVSIAPPRVVATGIVQDIQIADSTGEIPLSAWDVNVNKFEQSQIYFFRNLTVRTYRNKKSLTLTKQSSYTITQTELLINDDTDPLQQFTNASIVGVQHFNSHYSCVNCSSRLVNTDNEYGRCSKCSILQSVSICKVDVSCNIFFQNNQNSILLKVSTGIIAMILGQAVKFTEVALLQTTSKINITYNEKGKYVTDITFD